MSGGKDGLRFPGAGGSSGYAAPPREATSASSAPRLICPGEGTRWPPLDSRLVTPETREEMVGGVRMETMASEPPHGDSHFDCSAVLAMLLHPDYVGSIDMLTRYAEAEDFAADITVRRGGINPQTHERYLEELALEIGNTQRRAELSRKAKKMTLRGVRRIFAIMVREQSAYEWDAQREELRPVSQDVIWDEATLLAPLPLALLLLIVRGAAGLVPRKQVVSAVKDFAAEALDAQGNRVIQRIEERGERRGEQRMAAQNVLMLLDARGIAVDELSRRRILACDDIPTLQRWLVRAATAPTLGDIFTG